MSPKVLIATPTYNEAENLKPFLSGVFDVLPYAHVLIIDDASPDGTGAMVDEIAKADSRVHVIHRAGKLGLGSAYKDAFRWALARDYDLVFEMDADLSHDAKYLSDFLTAIENGADAVIGSRNISGGRVEGWGPYRHLLSKGGSIYSRMVLGLPIRDLTSGFKAFRRGTLEKIDFASIYSEGYSFQIEMSFRVIRSGLTIKEVPIVFVDRRAGQSKMSQKIIFEAIVMPWKLRANAFNPTEQVGRMPHP